MSNRRAKLPVDPAANKAANEKLWADNPELKNRKLTMAPEDYKYRKAWMDAYTAAGGAVEGEKAKKPVKNVVKPCEPCKITKVELKVEKVLLTLKQERECKLEIEVTGSNFSVDEYRIEIKKAGSADWCVLARANALSPWKAVIAGKFKLRGVVKACGGEHMSAEKDVEVRFPSYSDIIADPTAKAAMDAEWQNTKNDCTQNPNQRREKAFWIILDTSTNAYEHSATSNGAFVGPIQGASVNPGARPGDNPNNPAICDVSGNPSLGAKYTVSLFHTHTSTEFRAAFVPAGSTRAIGPSGADNNYHTAEKIPGVVYDYTESPVGSGSIPMGHPTGSAAQFYLSLGLDRRPTPN